jgi:hypothetical protein
MAARSRAFARSQKGLPAFTDAEAQETCGPRNQDSGYVRNAMGLKSALGAVARVPSSGRNPGKSRPRIATIETLHLVVESVSFPYDAVRELSLGIYFSQTFSTQLVLQTEQPCLLHRALVPSAAERGYATVVEAKAASERCDLRLDPAGGVEDRASVLSAAGQDGAIGGSPTRGEEGSRWGRPCENEEGLDDSKGEKDAQENDFRQEESDEQ